MPWACPECGSTELVRVDAMRLDKSYQTVRFYDGRERDECRGGVVIARCTCMICLQHGRRSEFELTRHLTASEVPIWEMHIAAAAGEVQSIEKARRIPPPS